MKTREERLTRSLRVRTRGLALLAIAVAAQAGCGREFFREWANQDASEAVFEKSRDPRWRLDLFSIEPPAMARFSNPYDPDRPPAPPDDRATEALSPVPQLPDNRLLIPAEGTGYLDMLEVWRIQRANRPAGASTGGYGGAPVNAPPVMLPTAPPPPPPSASPFSPPPAAHLAPSGAGTNSGTNSGPLTPILVPDARPSTPLELLPPASPPSASPAAEPGRPQVQSRSRDAGVTLSAFQQTGLAMPVPNPAPQPNAPLPSGDIRPPAIGGDPRPGEPGADLSAPINPRPDLTPNQYRASEAMASELAGILVPGIVDFDEAEAAGLPKGTKAYTINMQQAFTLALINSRVYQTNLENIYAAALSVTLQRFTFTPQLYAGMSPSTPTSAGLPSPIPITSFVYQTRESGAPASALNIGTVAGVGKVFSSGARLVAGFANQIVFNFIGKNSFQPRVQSFLPLTLAQPFLRGGGRAVTLELLTQAERNLVYQIRSFAKFRQEFTVAILAGGQIQQFGSAVPLLGFSGGGNSDPTTGFLNVVEDIQLVENSRRNIDAFAKIVEVYKELINGESSGLTALQLDQVDSSLQGARLNYVGVRTQYRFDLDQFKQQMGLPPDTPLIPDRSVTRQFKVVFDEVDNWQRDPRRELKDLDNFPKQLPALEDLSIDGRSVQGVYAKGNNTEEQLEDLLLAAERLGLEHRLDLMNARAQLYDAWRQVKVSANALQGVFTLTLTNQFLTPPTTTNPFGFTDQAKQFSLVMNAELPLVRLAERNTFRTSLINYERARRTLQNLEDAIKLLIRQDVRLLHNQYLTYEIQKRNFVLNIRVKDQAFEQIIAPPAAGAAAQGAVQTNNVIGAQQGLLGVENNLISSWYQYEVARLSLYRDLGTLPFDEWEAFHELFPTESLDGATPYSAARHEGTPRVTATRPQPEPAAVAR
jgi:hypothetical protein